MERTTSPYQLPDALGDLATTISGLNTDQLSDSLATLAQTFADTPPDLQIAVRGRGAVRANPQRARRQPPQAARNANKATGVLAKRTDQVVSLVQTPMRCWRNCGHKAQRWTRSRHNSRRSAQQLKGFIAENRQQLRPALDKLNGVLAIVDNRKERMQTGHKGLNTYAMSLGESVSSGPFFKAYVANLLPGQFVQPFVDAAFSDLGLDPNVLLPSQLTDPQIGQPATPALPVPFPRTGQGGEPHLTCPTRSPATPAIRGAVRPAAAARPHCCYPYREPLPAPPPGGPPPGPPAPSPPELQSIPDPRPRRSTSQRPVRRRPTQPGGQP